MGGMLRLGVTLSLCALAWLATPAHAALGEIVPAEVGETIAFVERGGVREALLVVAVSETQVSGVPLGTADAFAGLARSAAELAALRAGPQVELPLSELLPVIEGGQHVAGGANYREHGKEVDVAAPFLFPKVAVPTAWKSDLTVRPEWLLDYEVEIGVLFDRDVASASDVAGARAGVFLANDFTERAQLTREADLSTPGVGGGFANAKGKSGFLPTGPFLVIPRDWPTFVRDCEIRLHVNGAERQRARGADMTWDVEELVRRTLALGAEPRFEHEGRALALTPGHLPRGMAILTGTPGGVAFRTPGLGFMAGRAAWWALSLAFLDTDAASFVKEAWIESLRESGALLRAGDVVIAEGHGLGAIVTHLEAR
jgi:2-keto-4-pentenoate hydratase/2-oxohepta-3-ene-1,7-dioic acid hydratase in catechol pathway